MLKGDLVLYKNGSYKLGKIKNVFDDHCFVWYHTGDTAACTNKKDLIKIENGHAFLILKRNACTDSIQDTEARQLALKVIEAIENKFYDLTNTRFFEHLDDSAPIDSEYYYEFEDVATEVINDYKSNIR